MLNNPGETRHGLFGSLWRKLRGVFVFFFDRLLDGTEKGKPQQRSDYVGNAEWVIHESQARGSRILLWVSLLATGGLLFWAGTGSIDEVVRGEGKVVPSRQVQIIQSLDGGIVEEILVRPGQEVEAGEILLKIDSTRFASSLGENNAEYLSLLAKAARLQALATGDPFVAPPEVLAQAPGLVEMERNAWQARTTELNATVNVAREQLKQRQEDLRETIAKRDQASASCGLTSRELQVTRPLLKSGAVSEVDLLRLQRDVARYCGEQKGAEAQIDRFQASIKEAESKLQEAELNIRNQARNELSETNTKLATLRQGKLALADRVKLAEVRAPVRGTVKTLFNNTVGGVVQPGKDIIEIVPKDDTLLLEVRIQPRDIGFLHADQKAEVKFTAYDFAIYGGLEGKVEQIGADTVTDEKGNSYYVVRVRTDRSTVGDKLLPIIPGMVAEVHILTGKRTVLQYLLKPILRAKANAFTER
ncbi:MULTISPECIES: HlyD family type I secretion periplasmic adaptor subunit [Achromobacter]|uniref:Membrane fusion protein (MFP) family protein n=1 Tax=Alcaligenes xylosoxydans xylosoxydans TaxID=85698 RepID=A0A424W3T0_ALCXX|nr:MULTISPECIES: HlyD family type I secretion periplasmic adaptor subunit [Achromobacter]MBC9906317.1 HlyD family type I secretion periplasmic adaptor subunit [Achromobacter xylosoxidans]MBD0872735.1 HlyD family type I secretion periplasmic adaptor subunit [Achromobacter xylosoxidans]MDH1304816.1 HlyD family type I secretion periplasmic adaptor subunit [Achromobacter sp. GD03932]QNP83958.1 HlyD family type I secretion periplasmic adaptor subunit [Achromobacter xylosoxidans]RPJ87952.1 HlyD fami